MDLSIGEAARLTGLSVRTIRYYSDIGLVAETGRSRGRYRRYDATAVARLELVRTLRDLGLGLAAIRRVAERRTGLEEVARMHAEAIDLQIRQLTLHRSVLRAVARGAAGPDEVRRMTRFAQASAAESRRIVEEFLDTAFAGHSAGAVAQAWRPGLPQLPDEPTAEQVDAWVELAGLVQDPAFRARVREMVVEGARRAGAGAPDPDAADLAAGHAVVERAGAAVAARLDPGDPAAADIVDGLAGLFATAAGREDGPSHRAELATRIARFSDRRVERYWQLTAAVNGWPAQAPVTPAYEWLAAALRLHPAP